MNTPPDPDNARTLEILDIVQRNEQFSQRHLAQHLGVALGLANSYLKRCIKKAGSKSIRPLPTAISITSPQKALPKKAA